MDAARGAALVAMVVFHARWDATALGIGGQGGGVGPGWQLFGDAVAASFLLLSGASLVFAKRRGATSGDAVRRLILLGGVALAITAVTGIWAPRRVVVFGIIHCIVAGSLLTVPLLRTSGSAAAGAAVLLFATPLLPLPNGWDGLAAGWLGLGSVTPDTLDYRPLAPWAGFVPLGAALARSVPERWLAGPRWGALGWAGRRSLLIYLTHQAVLYPAFALLALLLGSAAPPVDWEAGFDRQCRADCEAVGAAPALCRSTCDCTRDAAARAGLNRAGPNGARMADLAAACLRAVR